MNLNRFLKRNGRPDGIQKANQSEMRKETWFSRCLAVTHNFFRSVLETGDTVTTRKGLRSPLKTRLTLRDSAS
jgi:hypothetical protein